LSWDSGIDTPFPLEDEARAGVLVLRGSGLDYSLQPKICRGWSRRAWAGISVGGASDGPAPALSLEAASTSILHFSTFSTMSTQGNNNA